MNSHLGLGLALAFILGTASVGSASAQDSQVVATTDTHATNTEADESLVNFDRRYRRIRIASLVLASTGIITGSIGVGGAVAENDWDSPKWVGVGLGVGAPTLGAGTYLGLVLAGAEVASHRSGTARDLFRRGRITMIVGAIAQSVSFGIMPFIDGWAWAGVVPGFVASAWGQGILLAASEREQAERVQVRLSPTTVGLQW